MIAQHQCLLNRDRYSYQSKKASRRGFPSALTLALLVVAPLLVAQSLPSGESVENARALVAANQLTQANEMLSAIVSRDPHNLAVWQELGEVQLAQSLNDDAMKSFEAVLKINADSPQAHAGEVRAAIASALADRAAGNYDRALATLMRARGYVPDSVDVLVAFGIQADSMQIYKDADEALSEAHRLEPQNPRALYALAHVELDEQKMSDAEANLRAYLKIKNNDASAHYGLGHLLYMLSKDGEAKVELEHSIALQPHQTESYYELGQIALDSHDDATARQDYEKVLASAPNHGGALTGMGVLAYRARDYATADNYLKQAVIYAPDYVTAHRYYAMTLARLGQQEQSQRELEIAQQLTEEQNKLRHGYALRPIQ
jgi:tetratricopeptide (TPR) repeat protein